MDSDDEFTATAFADLIRSHIVTENEVAAEIMRRELTGEELRVLVEAVTDVKGYGVPITGPLRTAIRSAKNLPPLTGD